MTEAPRLWKAGVTVVQNLVAARLSTPGKSAPELAPGEAAVVNAGGRRCAAYRDADGVLHQVSATCTHLGCIVRFNDADTTWECPCHGSASTSTAPSCKGRPSHRWNRYQTDRARDRPLREQWFTTGRYRECCGHQIQSLPGGTDMTAQGIITAIIVGAIIGALGRLVLPGRQNIPIWLTIVVGIVAAIIGTIIAGALDVKDTAGFDWIEFFIQVVLAAVGVALVSGMYGRRRIN